MICDLWGFRRSTQVKHIIELVLLKDFEYDEDAKKWCNWAYFKRFLEGGALPVARPKTRGSNTLFTSDAPVFLTAPQEVVVWRGRKLDQYETDQMNARIKYRKLRHTIAEKYRKEAPPCARCGARCYLEGRASSGSASPAQGAAVGGGPAAQQATASASSLQGGHLTGQGMVQSLKDLKELKDASVLDSPEFERLKAKVLAGL